MAIAATAEKYNFVNKLEEELVWHFHSDFWFKSQPKETKIYENE
jgi:hypothetical protein